MKPKVQRFATLKSCSELFYSSLKPEVRLGFSSAAVPWPGRPAFSLWLEGGNVFRGKSHIHLLYIPLQLSETRDFQIRVRGEGDLFHEWTKMECFHFQWALSQVNISRSKLVLKLNYSYLSEHSRERLWSVCTFTKGILAGWPPIPIHSGWKRGYNNHLVWQWYWTDDIFWTILNE